MEQQALTRKDMIQYFGSPGKVSDVLDRKRPLSISMIRQLEKGLGIPADVLIQEYGENSQYPKQHEFVPAFAIGESNNNEDDDFKKLGETLNEDTRLWKKLNQEQQTYSRTKSESIK